MIHNQNGEMCENHKTDRIVNEFDMHAADDIDLHQFKIQNKINSFAICDVHIHSLQKKPN